MNPIRTEFPFKLPIGLVHDDGTLLREGVMRLSTAADEIATLGDLRVKTNSAYWVVVKLSRVITRLGHLDGISPFDVERMYSADIDYLVRLHDEINQIADESVAGSAIGETESVPGNIEASPSRVSSIKR
ncbi:hypothetical protein [Trinickia dinghuensis]|uniref:hypothetical protein n=1 Tax=Trinickia dinghuensis TaxID=2291023 RepID=UPI0015F17640|nr:hypothetical protein [Trinickia dinghuensis]